MKLLTRDEYTHISEGLKYHIDNKLSITESIFRLGSDAYLDLVNEVRSLHADGKINLNEDDTYIVEKLQTGKKGTWKNPKTGKKESVTLDDPHLRKPSEPTENLYIVYRPNEKGEKDPDTGLVKAIVIGFGEKPPAGKPDVRQKHQEEGRRKAFLARHKCAEEKNQYGANWWACNMHLFWNQLGLKTNDPW
jgi:hypothetical protein